MPYGSKDSKNEKPKAKPEKGSKATPPRDLPILTPARKPRGQGQGR
ncbi:MULTISPECIES: hypothetical protein [Kribbella]|uniref:Uncharacterized protein n=1 Tax=Kribbella pratensis TaxID=2512112 RepID=A0ABY2FB89_9ACTN|nr:MULTISPECIES: hypothetical protein [Kribbella]TDW87774.1 hypothetical protein EV137_5857 [Kribbella pratensis]TDW89029.1 hypothetical protein EV647_6045 [Kribbella sp. VKM Ac-2566]